MDDDKEAKPHTSKVAEKQDDLDIQVPEITQVDVDDIKLDQGNPNKMNKQQMVALKENIKKYGFLTPIITNKNHLIADGEHRYLAGKELGMKKIPTIVLEVDEINRRMLRQVMNKLKGTHVPELDIEEYKYIKSMGAQDDFAKLLPSETDQFDKAMKAFDSEKLEDDGFIEVEAYERVKGRSKVMPGDIYRLGKHRLMCGDATNEGDVIKLLNGEKADLVLTDPPFVSERRITRHKDNAEIDQFDESLVRIKNLEYSDHLFKHSTGVVLVFNGAFASMEISSKHRTEFKWFYVVYYKKPYMSFNKNVPFLQSIYVSHFRSSSFNLREMKTVIECSDYKEKDMKELHSYTKSIDLLSIFIKNLSKQEDIVLDVFGGSGSTLITCEQLQRRCAMMEIDTTFCQVIIDRWEKLTEEKAEKIN